MAIRRVWWMVVVSGFAALASDARAQPFGTLIGRVLNEATEIPLAGAAISIPGIGLAASSDSSGEFRLSRVPGGRQIVWVRRVGFGAISTVVNFTPGDTVEYEFMLLPAIGRLPEVEVTAVALARGKLVEFDDRRRAGFGHFITGDQLEKMDGRQLSEILATVPGQTILRGLTKVNGNGQTA